MKRTYGTLDGLRGLAAALVVAFHAPAWFGDLSQTHIYLAVDLFFGLSGFVLAHAYGEKLKGDLEPWRFMALRVARLYPLYVLGLGLGFAAELLVLYRGDAAMSVPQVGAAMIAGLAMLPAWNGPGGFLYPLNVPSWSLLFELIANLAMALFWRRMSNTVVAWILGLSAAGLILGVAGPDGLGNMDAGATWATSAAGLCRVGFSFFAGILVYRLRDRVKISIPPWIVLALAAIAMLAPTPGAVRPAYELGCVLVGAPALIALAARREPKTGVSVLKFLGLTSYAVYVLHTPLLHLSHGLFVKLASADTRSFAPWAGMVFLGALLALCWAVDRFYDTPIRIGLNSRIRALCRERPGKV